MNDAAKNAARDQRVCAYVATSYVLGIHAAESLKGLRKPGPGARALLAGLAHPERTRRARTLAAALAPIIRALDHRRLA